MSSGLGVELEEEEGWPAAVVVAEVEDARGGGWKEGGG